MEISTISRKLLRDLCTNSRITITELSKKYELSRKVVTTRIAALETELGIRYLLELNYEALGFTTLHIAYFKFLKRPKAEKLRTVLEKSNVVQLAVATKGDIDMVVFALARHSIEYFNWEVGIQLSLAEYGVSVTSSEVMVDHLGFIPLNINLIKESNLKDIYKKILVVLNENSRISQRELSKKVGFSEGLTKYYLGKLNREGIIKRYTAVITKSPLKQNIIYFANYTIKEGLEKRIQNERRTMYFKEPDAFPIVNEFQLMFSTTGGATSFTWACYENIDEGVERSVNTHKRMYRVDSPIVRYAIATEIISGVAPIRNIDIKENYDISLGFATP